VRGATVCADPAVVVPPVVVVVVVVVVLVVVVVVVVVVGLTQAPTVSPCFRCARHARTLIVIVTNGLPFECVW
jgi:hypothetical protein